MAQKKRTLKVKSEVSAVPELPRLTQEELLKVQLFSAQANCAAAEAKNIRTDRLVYIQQIDPRGQLAAFEQKLVELTNAESTARLNYEKELAQIEGRLGLQLSKGCTVNPVTGEVIRHEKKE